MSTVDDRPGFWRRMLMRRPMQLRLVRRRLVWCPTWFGAFCMIALLVSPLAWWYLWGESFLSATSRVPAEVLVVEGWIGEEGVRAACAEFRQHGYRYIVATGGMTGERWEPNRWSYADVTQRELIRAGIPQDQVVVATVGDVKNRRTFQSAMAVRQALQVRGIQPKGLNVFTLGPHAARSRLVFAKVFAPETKVGVIDWTPSDYEPGPWWRSSERAREMIAETTGYLFELLFNSGRSPKLNQTSTDANRNRTGQTSTEPPRSDGSRFSSGRLPGYRFEQVRDGTFWTAGVINP